MQFVLFNPSGATTPSQSGPGSNGNEGILRILQCSSITGTPPSDCHIQDTRWGVLPLCRGAVGVFYSPSRLGNEKKVNTLKWVGPQIIWNLVFRFLLFHKLEFYICFRLYVFFSGILTGLNNFSCWLSVLIGCDPFQFLDFVCDVLLELIVREELCRGFFV